MITEKHLTFSNHSSDDAGQEAQESKEMSHLSRRDLTCGDVHDSSDQNVFSGGPQPTQYVFDQSSMPSQINQSSSNFFS
jgi:hypothetical protein